MSRLACATLVAALLAAVGPGVVSASVDDPWQPTVRGNARAWADAKFSFAVIPDTQMEVHEPTDTRFRERSQWLVDHAAELDLRYVTHTGDVVDWDTPDHAQTAIASAALRPLEAAGIPYSLSIGNHDTQATGVGGSARDHSRTHLLQRDTTVFNSFFTAARYGAVGGAFEPNKVDNIYSTFTAGKARWLVLNLELWPRVAVVSWARNVVASHSGYNVIIATHSYLNADTSLSTSSSYGDTSPQYLYDNLIKLYPNITMVFSGHAGLAAERVDVGRYGNKIVSYLQTFHSRTSNPVRLVEVNTATGTIATRIYAPRDRATYPQYADGEGGMAWVKLPES